MKPMAKVEKAINVAVFGSLLSKKIFENTMAAMVAYR